jgi:hypothetical protein
VTAAVTPVTPGAPVMPAVGPVTSAGNHVASVPGTSMAPPHSEGQVKSEYFSDNSQSLPGILGMPGPVGFEPGMFRTKESDAENGHSKHHRSDSMSKVNAVIYTKFL